MLTGNISHFEDESQELFGPRCRHRLRRHDQCVYPTTYILMSSGRLILASRRRIFIATCLGRASKTTRKREHKHADQFASHTGKIRRLCSEDHTETECNIAPKHLQMILLERFWACRESTMTIPFPGFCNRLVRRSDHAGSIMTEDTKPDVVTVTAISCLQSHPHR